MTELKDFVVEYSPRWCHIEDISVQSCEALEQYKQGFEKHKRRCPDAKFGDFFYWNNSGWAIVKAKSARDALNKYMFKMVAHDRTVWQKEIKPLFDKNEMCRYQSNFTVIDEFITADRAKKENKSD